MANTNTSKEDKSRKTKLKNCWNGIKRMLGYTFSKVPWYFLAYIITIIIISVLPFVGSWVNSMVLDGIVELVGVSNPDYTKLFYFGGISLGLMLFRTLNGNLNDYLDMNIWFNLGRELSHDVTTKYSQLDIEYYENSETMDLLNKVKENYGSQPQRMITQVTWFFSGLVSAVSALSILVYFNPLMIVVLFVTTIPSIVINMVYGQKSYGIWDAKGDIRRDYWMSRNHLTSERSLMELRIFKVRNYLLDRTYNLFYNFQKEQISIENKRKIYLALVDVLRIVGYAYVFIYTGNAAITAVITIGQFNFYLQTARNLQSSLDTMFRRFSRVFESSQYVDDIFKVLDLKGKIENGSKVLEGNSTPKIEFRNVVFKYPDTDRVIFDNFNLTINPGEHIAIVGENGAGKSTLIKLLMRFYDVTSGEILIDGINIKDLDIESWYEKVGALFQDFNFYHFDAHTNISVGNPALIGDRDRVVDSAIKSGADDFISEYDQGYETTLNKAFEGGIELSVGQKQKVGLARAYFKDAPVLILDEPTSAIDPKAEYEIFERLFREVQGKSVIIISHRFSTVRNADRILVVEHGQIIEDGSHEELLALDGVYKQTFEIQKKGYE